MRPRTLVTRRLQAPRLEPAVDEIDRSLGTSRRVRPVTSKPSRKPENFSIVRRQRQCRSPSLILNYRLFAHTTNRTRISLLALPLVLRQTEATLNSPYLMSERKGCC